MMGSRTWLNHPADDVVCEWKEKLLKNYDVKFFMCSSELSVMLMNVEADNQIRERGECGGWSDNGIGIRMLALERNRINGK